MHLPHARHLAYCTNIHRGESWEEILAALQRHALEVRDRVLPGRARPFAIGLRLSARAARELSDPGRLADFRRWLDRENAYVFTINGFPFGQFHGTRVKEEVYRPDWTHPDRLAYTNLLFDLLAQIVPAGCEGSVSTVPVSFKAFGLDARALRVARDQLWACVEHIEKVSRATGRVLHLGLEPEPLCTLETSREAVDFFHRLREDRPGDLRLQEHLGINYDCCHLAVEFETASEALDRLHHAGIKLSKIHLSNALRLQPTHQALVALRAFADDTYLHQVVERDPRGQLHRHRDLPDLLAIQTPDDPGADREWRVHFHVPLHHQPAAHFQTTADHVAATLDWLRAHPNVAPHLEMETYTWDVLPAEVRSRSVVDQLAAEYAWTLGELRQRGLA